jgi:hypothetical protein
VQKVVHSIRVHSGPSAPSPRSDEAKILQDADTIDKVGAVSITTFLLHYGSKKMLPEQVLAELKKDMPERLRWYYRTMNFPQGKRMMGEGCSYIREFILDRSKASHQRALRVHTMGALRHACNTREPGRAFGFCSCRRPLSFRSS